MRALRGVGRGCRCIASVERGVAPDRMHDHCQFARHGDTSFAVAGTFGDRLAPALDLVPVLEVRQHSRRRPAERAPHARVAGLRDTPLNVDRSWRPPAPRGQPEVGRDVARMAEPRPIIYRSVNDGAITEPSPGSS